MRAFTALLLVGLTGCTTSRPADLSSPSVRHEINARAERGHPVVHLVGQRGRQARSLHVAPDVTTWVDKKTGEVREAPTSEVEAIAFRRDGLGALEGIGIGVVTGAVLGAIVGATDEGSAFDFTPAAAAVLYGTGGVEFGALFGAIRSDRFVYEAVPCAGVPLACATGAPPVSVRQ